MQKTAYEMRISDWSADVCSSDLGLSLTPDAQAFCASIREEPERELLLLNANIPQNDKVRLLWRGDNRISITPFKPLPEPKGLASIKSEIGQRWPMTGLLDVLKEAALDRKRHVAGKSGAVR